LARFATIGSGVLFGGRVHQMLLQWGYDRMFSSAVKTVACGFQKVFNQLDQLDVEKLLR